MRSKFLAVAAAFAISLLGATGASAATEAGSSCVGNETLPGTAVGLANGPTSPLPATIPSGGVITRWRMAVQPPPPGPPVIQAIKIFRPTGPATELEVVGESAPIVLVGGTNDHATRIRVQAGDHIGGVAEVAGQAWGIVCKTGNPDDRIGIIPGNPGVGATTPVAAQASGYQVPIVVTVERDADNDGFGDETQDGCPQNAASQAPCPTATPTPLALSTTQQVRKGSVTIVVTASTAAPISVLGVVKLGKGKKATLNGGTQNLVPGAPGRFTLKFTKKVKKKLKALPRKRSLRLDVTVSGTGASGAVTTSALKIKLKGQAK